MRYQIFGNQEIIHDVINGSKETGTFGHHFSFQSKHGEDIERSFKKHALSTLVFMKWTNSKSKQICNSSLHRYLSSSSQLPMESEEENVNAVLNLDHVVINGYICD